MYFLKRGWWSTNFFLDDNVQIQQIVNFDFKKQSFTLGIPKQLILVALTKFLAFFKSRKIISFSYLNSTDFNNNFNDDFMWEKVIK